MTDQERGRPGMDRTQQQGIDGRSSGDGWSGGDGWSRAGVSAGAGQGASTAGRGSAAGTAGRATSAPPAAGREPGSRRGQPAPTPSPRRRAAAPSPAASGGKPYRASAAAAASRTAAPRRARLVLTKLDPWSVFKVSAFFSFCMVIVWLIAVAVLYAVLASMGVFDSINQTVKTLTDNGTNGGTGLSLLSSPGTILWYALLVGVFMAFLSTALATVGAFLYNVCTEFAGGLEVTLAERD